MGDYNTKNKKRGQAVIIANTVFDTMELSDLSSPGKDLELMQNLFKNLDFYVSKNTYKNLNKDQMLNTIRKACTNSKRNKESDCFVLYISTHGEESKITKQKGLPVGATEWRHGLFATDGHIIYVDEILEMFQDTEGDTNGLNGKPKLFFFDACRSTDEEEADFSDSKFFMYDPGFIVPVKASDQTEGDTIVNFTENDLTEFVDIYACEKDWQSDEECTERTAPNPNTETESTVIDNDGSMVSNTGGAVCNIGTKPNDQSSSSCQKPNDKNGDKGEMKSKGKTSGGPEVKKGILKNVIRHLPLDIVTLNCPRDCLIMYPVQPHKTAFGNAKKGSIITQSLCAENSIKVLLQQGLLKYLTAVTNGVSKYEYKPDKEELAQFPEREDVKPFKMTATIVHRLTDSIFFAPKGTQSRMVAFTKRLQQTQKN